MAALNFPTSPTTGDVYTANGKSWTWDGTSWVTANQPVALENVFPRNWTTITTTPYTLSLGQKVRGVGASNWQDFYLPTTFSTTDDPIWLWHDHEYSAGYLEPGSGDNFIYRGHTMAAGEYFYPEPGCIYACYPYVDNTTWLILEFNTRGALSYDPMGSNGTGDYDGPTCFGYVGATVTTGQLLYGAGTWNLADADSASTMPVTAMALEARTGAGDCRILLPGSYYKNTGFSMTAGALQYASTTTGGITQTPPSGTGDIVQVIGVAVTATCLWFMPSLDFYEVA